MVVGRPSHVASAPKLCPKGLVVELRREIVEGKGGKEGEGGRPTSHAWHPLNPYFHPLNPYFHALLHLAPIMLTPLTKSIKSKANSFHPFPESFLFIYFFDFFRFYIMQ
jgi:hypothetical protein